MGPSGSGKSTFGKELEKDINGFIKPKATINENGESEVAEITPNQQVQMVNNYLEKSNVNPVEELILTLEHQRNYETHVVIGRYCII